MNINQIGGMNDMKKQHSKPRKYHISFSESGDHNNSNNNNNNNNFFPNNNDLAKLDFD